MTALGAAASLALPLVALPILVGGVMRWWLKTKLRSKVEVGAAAAALYIVLLYGFGLLVGVSDPGAEVEGSAFLLLFLGLLGVPLAVAVALRVRSVIARDATRTGT
jgi:hypothetical protein